MRYDYREDILISQDIKKMLCFASYQIDIDLSFPFFVEST